MNKRINNFFKEQKEIIIATTIIVVAFLAYYVFIIKKPFLLSNDQWFQYNEFYKEWIRLIKDFINGNGFPFYSWNMYLGTDFYSSMVYYCVGDIFLPILMIFRNNIEIGLIIETILCVYISAITMNKFLIAYNINNKITRIFISLIYAFGAEAMIYFGNYMFHRFYAFLPLLFLGALQYINDKRKILFIISATILFMQNFYMMYPTLIFLFMFCVLEEYNRKKCLKEIFKDFFVLLASLIVGFMISSVIVLPGILSIIENPRLGEVSNNSIRWDRNVYYGLYMSLTSFNPVDIEGNIFYTTHEVHDTFYNLFIGIIPLISFVNYIINKKNYPELILFLILFVIVTIKPLNSIMHGFSEPSLRWLFLLEFYILVVSAKGMDYINKRNSIIFVVIYFLLFVYFIFEGNKRYWINLEYNAMHVKILIYSIIINLVIFVVFMRNKRIALLINVIFIVVSLMNYQYLQTRYSYIGSEPINREDVDYFASVDEDRMYRCFMDYKHNNPNAFLNKNKSLSYGFMSTTTYSSTFDTNINMFNKISGAVVGLDWMLDVRDPYINTALGNKYYIVYKEEELPSELEFEYVYNLNHLMVYKNKKFKGFGYTADNVDYTKNYMNSNELLHTIFIDDDSIDITNFKDIESSKLNTIYKDNNHFTAKINTKSENILFIPIPNNKGWKIKMNNEYVKPISVNGGFMGINVQKGINEIEMIFIPYGLKFGVCLTSLGVLLFFISFIKERCMLYNE